MFEIVLFRFLLCIFLHPNLFAFSFSNSKIAKQNTRRNVRFFPIFSSYAVSSFQFSSFFITFFSIIWNVSNEIKKTPNRYYIFLNENKFFDQPGSQFFIILIPIFCYDLLPHKQKKITTFYHILLKKMFVKKKRNPWIPLWKMWLKHFQSLRHTKRIFFLNKIFSGFIRNLLNNNFLKRSEFISNS